VINVGAMRGDIMRWASTTVVQDFGGGVLTKSQHGYHLAVAQCSGEPRHGQGRDQNEE